eukprot:365319-Chlamydomonas_euryale.AAC.25
MCVWGRCGCGGWVVWSNSVGQGAGGSGRVRRGIMCVARQRGPAQGCVKEKYGVTKEQPV